MDFDDKLHQLAAAKAAAETEFTVSIADTIDTYVRVGTAHVETEQQWLQAPALDDLREAAEQSWQRVVAARTDLLTAVTAAASKRATDLAEAWRQAKTDA